MLRRLIDKLTGSNPRWSDLEGDDGAVVFDQARAASDAGVGIIDPSGHLFFLPSPLSESVSEVQIAHARSMIPPEPRRIVTVIADTRISGSLAKINKTIPFIGILTGLAYIGHRVIVFDGQLRRIEQGCRDSDVLIVDGAVLPHLHNDWYAKARRVMRRPEIYVHDRNTYKLRPILPNPEAKP